MPVARDDNLLSSDKAATLSRKRGRLGESERVDERGELNPTAEKALETVLSESQPSSKKPRYRT